MTASSPAAAPLVAEAGGEQRYGNVSNLKAPGTGKKKKPGQGGPRAKSWNEGKHKRVKAGSAAGGEFATRSGKAGDGQAAERAKAKREDEEWKPKKLKVKAKGGGGGKSDKDKKKDKAEAKKDKAEAKQEKERSSAVSSLRRLRSALTGLDNAQAKKILSKVEDALEDKKPSENQVEHISKMLDSLLDTQGDNISPEDRKLLSTANSGLSSLYASAMTQVLEHDPVLDLDIYRDWRLQPITAAGYPVKPPSAWFKPSELGVTSPTPITILASGQLFGHIALWGQQHTGYTRRVNPPRSRSRYAYFHTGQLITADGNAVNVGNLTYAGGHAPVADADGQPVSAAAAVKHYDDTGSAFADVVAFEDQFGILVAGALRPTVTDEQLRVILASAPSGDWRPINGSLELIACCQVNVPGFPVVRALAASGTLTAASGSGDDYSTDWDQELFALVAAGAPDMYALRCQQLASEDLARTTARISELEAKVDALTATGDWADPDMKWSADAARDSLFAYAEAQTDDPTKYKALLSSAFLFVGGDGANKEDYHLPVAVARNGQVKYVWSGLTAAIAELHGARGGVSISDGDKASALQAALQLHSEGRKALNIDNPAPVAAATAPTRDQLREQFALAASGVKQSKTSARTEFLRHKMAYLTNMEVFPNGR